VAAKLLQFFIVLGLAAAVLSKRKTPETGAEYYFIALGAFFIVMYRRCCPSFPSTMGSCGHSSRLS